MALFSKKQILIFSDLDGTILSSVDYSPGPSLSAVDLATKHGIDFVIVSSKTRAEIEFLQKEFGWNFPFISENGGAIYIPEEKPLKKTIKSLLRDGCFWKIEFGVSYSDICEALNKISERLEIKITAFHQLDTRQVAELAGLPLEQAKLTKIREYDEPFLVAEESESKIPLLIQQIEKQGLRYTRGGKYHHIIGDYNKGRAVKTFKELYQQEYGSIITAAIGDAKNDIPMFEQVEYPFLVRKYDGSFEMDAVIQNIVITDGIGPAGFAEAVEVLITNSYEIKGRTFCDK